jgi:hypothetical protein
VCGKYRGGCGEKLKFSGEKLKFAGEKNQFIWYWQKATWQAFRRYFFEYYDFIQYLHTSQAG